MEGTISRFDCAVCGYFILGATENLRYFRPASTEKGVPDSSMSSLKFDNLPIGVIGWSRISSNILNVTDVGDRG